MDFCGGCLCNPTPGNVAKPVRSFKACVRLCGRLDILHADVLRALDSGRALRGLRVPLYIRGTALKGNSAVPTRNM